MKSKHLLFGISALLIGAATLFYVNIKENKEIAPYQPRENSLIQAPGISGAIEYVMSIRNNFPSGELNHGDVIMARKEVEQFAKNNTAKAMNLNWQEVGPDNIGGRVRAILIDKDNPDIVFAGAVSGGLWKSTTGGSSWILVPSVEQNIAICCITQDKDGYIYVGTGESFASVTGAAFGSSGFIGKGIYRSSDKTTFALLPQTIPSLNSMTVPWAFVNELAYDKINNRIWAATNGGLKYSNDKGDTWINANISPNGNSTDVLAGSDGTIVASVLNKCYISTDNGATFTNHSTNLTGKLPSSVGRIEFAIAPSDPNYIYASAANTAGQMKGIYRSTDKGNTWTIIGPEGSTNFQPYRNQGTYNNIITVFPNNKDKILLGGIDLWMWHDGGTWTQKTLWSLSRTSSLYIHADHHTYVFHPKDPNIIYAGSDGGVSRSLNGGQTWHTLNKNFNTVQYYAIGVSHNGMVMGGTQDNGTLLIDRIGNTPKNAWDVQGGDGGSCVMSTVNPDVWVSTIYYGGLKRTPNRGGTMTDFFSNRMLALGVPGSTWPAGFVTPFVLWENNNELNSQDSVRFISDTTYAAGQKVIVRSANNQYPFDYVTPVALNKNDTILVRDIVQTKFFLGGRNAVWMTKQLLDFSKTPDWYKIAVISGESRAMAYSKDGNHLFVGTSTGNLYRISNLTFSKDSINTDVDGGKSVLVNTSISSGLPSRPVTSISVDPKNPNNVVVTFGNYANSIYIYRSTNALDAIPTWASKQGNLPAMPVYASLIEMTNTSTVLVGTEYGIYATNNINATSPVWTVENDGMEKVPVYFLLQQINNFPYKVVSKMVLGELSIKIYPNTTNYGVIYAGTHGRGIFETFKYLSVEKPHANNNHLLKPNLTIYPNPVTDRNLNTSITLFSNSSVMINIFDLNGRLIKSENLGPKSTGIHKVSLTLDQMPTGTYLLQVVAGKDISVGKFIVK